MTKQNELLQNAIADARVIQEQALENANSYLLEAFTPKIKDALEGKFKEEDEEILNSLVEQEEDDEEEEEDEEMEEEEDENEDEEEMEEEVELDLDSILDELKTEIKEEKEKGEVEIDLDKLDEEDEEEETEKEELDEDIVYEVDSLLEEFDIEDDEDELDEDFTISNDKDYSVKGNLSEDNDVDEKDKKIEELKRRLKKAEQKLNEVELINTKLFYANKLTSGMKLNETQKQKIVESFDRANSVREVKLTFTNLVDSFEATGKQDKKRERRNKLMESSSRLEKKTKIDESAVDGSKVDDGFQRMKELAGLSSKE